MLLLQVSAYGYQLFRYKHKRLLTTKFDRLDYCLRKPLPHHLYRRYCCFVHTLEFFSYGSL